MFWFPGIKNCNKIHQLTYPWKHKDQKLQVKYITCMPVIHLTEKLRYCKKILHEFVLHLLGLSNPQNITVYDEISEYEELKQNKQEKHYENNEVVEKIYVSLKPVVMETIRDHIQSTVSVLCQPSVLTNSLLTYT